MTNTELISKVADFYAQPWTAGQTLKTALGFDSTTSDLRQASNILDIASGTAQFLLTYAQRAKILVPGSLATDVGAVLANTGKIIDSMENNKVITRC